VSHRAWVGYTGMVLCWLWALRCGLIGTVIRGIAKSQAHPLAEQSPGCGMRDCTAADTEMCIWTLQLMHGARAQNPLVYASSSARLAF
jgi:hypothetical protein